MIKPTKYKITTKETDSDIIVELSETYNEIKIDCPDAKQHIWLSAEEAREVLRAMNSMLGAE